MGGCGCGIPPAARRYASWRAIKTASQVARSVPTDGWPSSVLEGSCACGTRTVEGPAHFARAHWRSDRLVAECGRKACPLSRLGQDDAPVGHGQRRDAAHPQTANLKGHGSSIGFSHVYKRIYLQLLDAAADKVGVEPTSNTWLFQPRHELRAQRRWAGGPLCFSGRKTPAGRHDHLADPAYSSAHHCG